MWKDFFYYSKAERRIILFLLLMALLLTGIYVFVPRKEASLLIDQDTEEMDSFLVHLKEKERKAVYRKYTDEDRTPILREFDPNTVDSMTLRELGLPAFMARNILRYREKGGVFRVPEDFARMYGLRENQFKTLLPYIVIAEKFQRRDTIHRFSGKKDSLPEQSRKYMEGTVIDLNSADTTELKGVPGIGTGLARMIVAYRRRLGGFHEVSQLQEIPHVGTEVNKWFMIKNDTLRKLYVNKNGLDKLRAHPYMNFYKAKAILEYRRKRGRIKGMSQLALFEEFTEADLKKLSPYLSFE